MGNVDTGGNVTNIALRWRSTGRIGIGQNVPANVLDVQGDGTTAGGVTDPEVVARVTRLPGAHSALSIDAPAGQDSILYLAESSAAQWGLRQDSSDAHKFNIRYHGGLANTTFVTVQTNGFVGIGTSTPTTNLDVRGDIKLGPVGQYFSVGGEGRLRIIRGIVFLNALGNLGNGYTATKTGTGTYNLSFTDQFGFGDPDLFVNHPTVVATAFSYTNATPE